MPTLAAGAQARVAEYAAALRADPFRREECTTRLRELDWLCRAIGVRTASQACAAAEVGHAAMIPIFLTYVHERT